MWQFFFFLSKQGHSLFWWSHRHSLFWWSHNQSQFSFQSTITNSSYDSNDCFFWHHVIYKYLQTNSVYLLIICIIPLCVLTCLKFSNMICLYCPNLVLVLELLLQYLSIFSLCSQVSFRFYALTIIPLIHLLLCSNCVCS